MHLVGDLFRTKYQEITGIEPSASVLSAAQLMNQHRIGALVVIDDRQLVGIITERDVLTRVVAAQRSPALTFVSQVMTENVFTCTAETPLCDLRKVMRERRIRHVPVMDAGRVTGMVSIGDLNAADIETLTTTISQLEAYICG